MKKILTTLFILIIFGLFGFFFIAGKIVDGQNNVLERHEYGEIPLEVQKFHQSLVIADCHADNLLWDRDIMKESPQGHVDIPRLQQGNFTLQVFSAVTKSPKGLNYHKNSGDTDNITLLSMANRWPRKTWNNLTERALYQSHRLHMAADRSNEELVIIRNKESLKEMLLQRAVNKKIVGGVLAIEGLHCLEGRMENMNRLYDAGYRMMGLTHFFDNEVGGSSAGVEQGGLTPFGEQVIDMMNNRNIIVDLAHTSPTLFNDVLGQTSRPVVVSHTGVRGVHDSPRNLTDQQIKAIAKNGGLIGIGFWAGAVGSTQPAAIVKSMKYVSNLVGVSHLMLGSDWDGSTTTYFDAAHLWILTQELMKSGFSEDEIRGIMGGNLIEFLLENLP